INLISNAIKFSDNNSKIVINAYYENSKSIVEIIDFGIGIKEKDIDRIFERFYQVDTSRSSEGHGLGLVIVKTILEKLGGEISVQSELNTKTIFTVKLP
ncbi:MAG TPA: ATP-binding protein, partial [Erysipelotrichaceae bacterium]|nr:ATP-binding protein [Erysipelotrichaceae bacterium]